MTLLLVVLVAAMPAVGAFAHHGVEGSVDRTVLSNAQQRDELFVGTRSASSSQRLLGSFQRLFSPVVERVPLVSQEPSHALVVLALQRLPHPPVPTGDSVLRI